MTKARTVYTVATATEAVATRTEKSRAVALADQTAQERGEQVTVTTGTGTVVHTAEAPAPVRKHFSPWTRVDSADFVDSLEVPAGFEVAYTRNRIKAAAARSTERDGWKILQLLADGTTAVFDAVNTKEGQEIFNQLRKEQLAARAESE